MKVSFKLPLKRILDLACLGLSISVVIESLLWLTTQYMVPCWTLALMSLGAIGIIQGLKHSLED